MKEFNILSENYLKGTRLVRKATDEISGTIQENIDTIDKLLDEVFTDNNGDVAESFADLLRAQSPDLYARYLSISSEDTENELTVLIDKIEELITALKYSPYSLGIESSSLIENLFRILRFFKSAKAEIIGYNVIYKITMRGVNFFKILDEWVGYHTTGKFSNDMYIFDFIIYIKNLMKFKRELTILKDQDRFQDETMNQLLIEKISWTNDLLMLVSQMYPPMEDLQEYIDFIMKSIYKFNLYEKQDQVDKLDIVDQYFPKGAAIFTAKDEQLLIDMLMVRAATPYIDIDIPLEDKIHKIEDAFDTMKLNLDNLIAKDELIFTLSEEFSSKFAEAALLEISAMYKYNGLETLIHITDSIASYTINQSVNDTSNFDSGFPGIESLLEVNGKYNHLVNEKVEMTDGFWLSDGTPLK